MSLELAALAWDANDPRRLAEFWAAALRWEVGEEHAGEVALVPTDGTRFGVLFVPVGEPKAEVLNRVHLDLTTKSVEDQQQSAEQFVALGGRHIDIGQSPDESHIVMADPEGNELCLIEPWNSFLSTTGRFGSITSDGSPATGRFWSAALDWPLVWDQDDETAIRAPDGTGPMITWGGGELRPKPAKNRQHLHLAPTGDSDQAAEVERLLALGATRGGIGEGRADRVVLLDPDDNEFCVLRTRERRTAR
ncbi:MAG TPA: VOC family protein [Acidimicrobiia bacterium]|jgi:predicted enzyme related to lactoylglutathione lyase|nr:VOC family protein [Acidimicrobiia bacterium]